MEEPIDLLTVPEVAQLLRISRAKAYDLVKKGEIPSVRIGRNIRVRKTVLQEWVKRTTEQGSASSISS